MADQDFNIKVVTTADTSGLKQTGAAIEDLGSKGSKVASLLGSLVGSVIGVGLVGIVKNVADKISEWAENIKRAAEEQRTLNREIDQAVKSYEKIRTPEQWDKENDKIEENIQKLRDKRAITTDPSQKAVLDEQVQSLERQQNALAILARLGLERAQHEEKVKLAIKDQINALAEGDRISERAVKAAEDRSRIENQLGDIRAKGVSAAVDISRERGAITEEQVVAIKAKIQKDADEEAFKRSQAIADQKISAINEDISRTKAQREEAEKGFNAAQSAEARGLKTREDAARLAQESADADVKAREAHKELEFERGRGGDIAGAQAAYDIAKKEADEKHRLLSAAENYVRTLDHGKAALEDELRLTKAILETRRQAEAEAQKRAAGIPEIEAQKKGEAELHTESQKTQAVRERGLTTLEQQHDQLADIAKSRGITEAERKAAYDAAQGLEPKIAEERVGLAEKARTDEAERMRKRTEEGPPAGLSTQELIDYFKKGPGAAPGSQTDKTLDQMLIEMKKQTALWQ